MPPNGEAGEARTVGGRWRLCVTVKRIVANIECSKPKDANAFYENNLGMDVGMDHGWIITFASDSMTMPQVSMRPKAAPAHRCPIFRSRSTIWMRFIPECGRRASPLNMDQ